MKIESHAEFVRAIARTIGTLPTTISSPGRPEWVIVLEKGSLTIRPHKDQGVPGLTMILLGVPEEKAIELGANKFTGDWNITPRAEAISAGEAWDSIVKELGRRLAKVGYTAPLGTKAGLRANVIVKTGDQDLADKVMPVSPEPIPAGIYWDQGCTSFFNLEDNFPPVGFYEKWKDRKDEFPTTRQEAGKRAFERAEAFGLTEREKKLLRELVNIRRIQHEGQKYQTEGEQARIQKVVDELESAVGKLDAVRTSPDLTISPDMQKRMLVFSGHHDALKLGPDDRRWFIAAKGITTEKGRAAIMEKLKGLIEAPLPPGLPAGSLIPAVRLTDTRGEPYAGLRVVEIRSADDGALEVAVEEVGTVVSLDPGPVSQENPEPEQQEGPDATIPAIPHVVARMARIYHAESLGWKFDWTVAGCTVTRPSGESDWHAIVEDANEVLDNEGLPTGPYFLASAERDLLLELLKHERADIAYKVQNARAAGLGFARVKAEEARELLDSVITKLETP